ncbi:hypothetical protein evm_010896 [Chilo suppressalis]|nr:hypothetical protein evm_010896 [Chilo suppressalis]
MGLLKVRIVVKSKVSKIVFHPSQVLPISWHASLHSGETGVDRRLSAITLDSIPRLRSFTNDTVLDVLFYTSPVFCQTIIDTVCAELNRIYKLFISRTPSFNGRVSLGGHSLGSVILYDLLCHQTLEGVDELKSYVEGSAGTGQGAVRYPSLAFRPAALYALGSPIAMFECIRGVKSLGDNFKLPTCQNFFNIFHPYDPIAYSLNGGRRVDYVLQETPLEMINEYLFAMSSHVCYWESEDTMLLILREIYDSLGVAPDSTVPQQSLTVQRQRPTKSNETYVVNTSEYPSTSRDGT